MALLYAAALHLDLRFLAGAAAGATVATVTITTTLVLKMLPPKPSEMETAELRKLYDAVEARHNSLVEKILPMIPETDILKNPDFREIDKRSRLLVR